MPFRHKGHPLGEKCSCRPLSCVENGEKEFEIHFYDLELCICSPKNVFSRNDACLSFTPTCNLQLKAKRSDCNAKATHTRNDYLLTLAAANAHHDRYYETDLISCIKVILI